MSDIDEGYKKEVTEKLQDSKYKTLLEELENKYNMLQKQYDALIKQNTDLQTELRQLKRLGK